MPDWTKSMQQTFEYYTVDPNTWTDNTRIENVKSSTINRDSEAETLGSATIDVANMLGECYVRAYLITIQNGITEKHALGTFLLQTPSTDFDGKTSSTSIDAYTPLLELKEKNPPLGYSIFKKENIMDNAYRLVRENARAPVGWTECSETLYSDFVANTDDKWITFIADLIANAKYKFSLDEMGRILFSPIQETESLQPVWTFDDGFGSILYPESTLDHDLYGIPNVVEVVYSNSGEYFHVVVKNEDPNSPTSIPSRGREIPYRVSAPDTLGYVSKEQIEEYAERLLRELSTLEYTVTIQHGYCPVRLDDCIRIDYKAAGLIDIKARVINQSIECVPGCPVKTKAVFTKKLWG